MEIERRSLIPVTLEGSNYLVWSRLARVTLGGHGLWDSHIMKAEASKKMTQEDSQASGLKNEDKWVQEDMLTLEIIHSSLSVSILEAYSHCESAKELWESLQKVYGNASNLSQVFKVKELINNLTQDEMEFNQFFGNFSSLWAKLDVLRPSSVDPEVLRERQEQDRVFSLLLALNPSYNSLIKHILRGERLPSLEDVCCRIQREHCAHSLFKEERKVVPPVRNMLDQKRHKQKLRKALKVKKRQVYEKIKSSMTALTKVVEQQAVNGLSMYSALTTEAVLIPCTLKGPGSYITWSRMTRAALGGRGLWEHVISSSAPKQITQGEDGKEIVVVDEVKWGQEDLMVLSILHSSLDSPLMDTYSHCTTPKQLWNTLQRVYGNTSNLTRIYEVKRAINTLQQEEGDFTKHLGKYSQLWSELEMLRPSSNDPETLEARREQDKIFGLFFTLSPSFNDVVRHILREKELPSYDEVCAQLQKEIGSDGLFGGGKGDLPTAHKAEKMESASANKAYFKPRGGGDKAVTCQPQPTGTARPEHRKQELRSTQHPALCAWEMMEEL
ncbi:hypothetical protein Bca4012_020288 [Brassica carinata]